MQVLSTEQCNEVEGGELFGRILGFIVGGTIGAICCPANPAIGVVVGGGAGALWGDALQDRINGENLPQ